MGTHPRPTTQHDLSALMFIINAVACASESSVYREITCLIR